MAMQRLHQGLKRANVDSSILTKVRQPGGDAIAFPNPSGLSLVERLFGRFCVPLGLNDPHCVSAFALDRVTAYRQADVIDFHCLQGGYFSYLALPSLTRHKPAVLTLHDIWPFTGHCAYSHDCERWKTGCGNCPHLDISPPIRKDNTRLEWRLKDWVYSRSKLAVVAPSRRIAEQANQSMLKRFDVHHIPHGIDTSVFRPYDQGNIRSLFGIGLDKRVIMFAAAKLSQINKGPDVLVQSLRALPGALKRNTVLLLLGDNSNGLREQLDIEVIHLGYASGDLLKALAYSAADLFVYPTRAETFGLVIQESMACGTPLVSFDVGGVSDLVRHNVTGYLAQPGDLAAFTGGIIQLLEDDKRRQGLGAKSREVIVNEFSIEGQVQRYMQLYSQLCRN